MAPVGSTQDSRAFRVLSLWQPHATAIALGLKPLARLDSFILAVDGKRLTYERLTA